MADSGNKENMELVKNMFQTPLTEKTKREIAELYQTTGMPLEAIALQLNVSVRSVHRFKDYGYSVEDNSKDQSQITFPEKTQGYKTQQWLCKTPGCGFITDKKNVFCPRCRRGPFFACFIEIGSPEYLDFIEKENRSREKKHEPETLIEHPKNEEIGIEPRNPLKYRDPGPQDTEELEDENKKDAAMTGDEEAQEFQWKCPKCGHEWNGYMLECPKCGAELQE